MGGSASSEIDWNDESEWVGDGVRRAKVMQSSAKWTRLFWLRLEEVIVSGGGRVTSGTKGLEV